MKNTLKDNKIEGEYRIPEIYDKLWDDCKSSCKI
jgi:hypothetical protein